MLRWILVILVILVAACGARSTPATGPGASQLAVQRARAGDLRVLGFDAHAAMLAMLGVKRGMPTAAVALPGGDWLVAFDGAALARIAQNGTVRWHRELAISDAILATHGLVVATLDDDSVIGLREDGSVAWRANGGALTSGAHLVRTPGATIVAHDGGEVAIDDRGRLLWSRRRADHGVSAVAAYVERAGLVVVHAAAAAPETAVMDRPRMQMVAELLDVRTGTVRAHTELAPDGDAWTPHDIAVIGTRVVVRATDHAVPKLVVLSAGETSIAVSDVFVEPAPEILALPRRPTRDEVAFVASGPRDARPLELDLVDIAAHAVRRVPLLRVAATGYVQLWRRHRAGDAFTFVGDLSGTLEVGDQRVRANVRKVSVPWREDRFAPLWFVGTLRR